MNNSNERVPPPHGNMDEESLIMTPTQTLQAGISSIGMSEEDPNIAQQNENLVVQSQHQQSMAQSMAQSTDAQSLNAQISSTPDLGVSAFSSSSSSTSRSCCSSSSSNLPESSSSGSTTTNVMETISSDLLLQQQEDNDPSYSNNNIPSQQTILPQDRSSLMEQNSPSSAATESTAASQGTNDDIERIENYYQQQQAIKHHLVYTPRDPAKLLPPAKQPKIATTSESSSSSSSFSKTPKPLQESRINFPPESGTEPGEAVPTTTAQQISSSELERRRMILRQQQQEEEEQTKQQQQRQLAPSSTNPISAMASTSSRAVSASPAPVRTNPPPRPPLELHQAHNYEELDIIGNGAYGTVYRGRDLTEKGRFVALKKIKITLTEDGVPVSAVREISLLKQLETFKHPNVVRLLDICHGRLERENRLNLVLVFEYVEMDLDAYLKRVPSPGLEPARIRNMMHQILSGVDFLHSNRIIHRDLKPQNILVDRYDRIKIADFGLARIYDYNMRLTSMVVTLWYRAPEVLLSNSYATPVDIWSCACIFAEMFRKRPLFDGQNEGEQLQRIFEVIGTPNEQDWPTDVSVCISGFRSNRPRPLPDVVPEISTEAADLLQSMLTFVPDVRASARQSLCHKYFKGLPVVTAENCTPPQSTSILSSSVMKPGNTSNIDMASGSTFSGTSTLSSSSTSRPSSSRGCGGSNTGGDLVYPLVASSVNSSMVCDFPDENLQQGSCKSDGDSSVSVGLDRSNGSGGSDKTTTISGSNVVSSNTNVGLGGLDESEDIQMLSSKSDSGPGNDENNPNSSNINMSRLTPGKIGAGVSTTPSTPLAALFVTPHTGGQQQSGGNSKNNPDSRN